MRWLRAQQAVGGDPDANYGSNMGNALAHREVGPPLTWLLSIAVLAPTLAMYIGVATSMTLGACIASVIVMAAYEYQCRVRPDLRSATRVSMGALLFVLSGAIMLHLIVASILRPVDSQRAIFSLMPFALIMLGGYGLGHLICITRSTKFERAVYFLFWMFCALSAVAVIGLLPLDSGRFFKPVFPFTEPSNFALMFLPLLMYCSISQRGSRRIAILAIGLVVGLAVESLTLIAGWLLVALVSLRRIPAMILLGFVALSAAQIDISYYVDRLNFGADSPNLSTLVYLQGWELIVESLRRSSGWGLGFQQLGVYGSDVDIADQIFVLIGGYLNLLDGGFALAKIISEFGGFGALLLLLYVTVAWRAARNLRRMVRDSQPSPPAIIFARCAVLSFAVELLVRGTGYFSGSTLVLVASLTVLAIRKHAVHNAGIVAPSADLVRPVEPADCPQAIADVCERDVGVDRE